MRYFNISGYCNSAKHYMIDASTRLKGVEQLIDMGQYFVIHVARQSGKTTYLQDLTKRLNAEGKYYVLYCSQESVMIEVVISGKDVIDMVSDDFIHLKDLGLIRTDNKRIELSNPVYAETIVRKSSAMAQRKFK